MPSLPILSSGSIAKNPTTIGVSYPTDMVQFVNDSEQRWPTKAPLTSFKLVYTDINRPDMLLMKNFFVGRKGRFVDVALTNTFSITDPRIPGQPFNYCFFDQDDFYTEEAKPNRYSFILAIRQARKN